VQADVLSLQEVIRPAEPSPPWLAYSDANRSLNQRADLFGDISKRVPNHTGTFQCAVEGPLKDTAGKTYRSEHGLAQWIGETHVVNARSDGFVHGTFRKDGWGAEPVPRAFQSVRLHPEGRKRPVTIAHFHGLRDPDGKHDTAARAAQARQAILLLSKITKPEDDVILSGDFNILPSSECFETFARWGLHDLVGETDTRTTLYPKPVRHANYMLVTRSVRVRSFNTPADPVVSDHRPLILEIE
jgi:hypothetical protein